MKMTNSEIFSKLYNKNKNEYFKMFNGILGDDDIVFGGKFNKNNPIINIVGNDIEYMEETAHKLGGLLDCPVIDKISIINENNKCIKNNLKIKCIYLNENLDYIKKSLDTLIITRMIKFDDKYAKLINHRFNDYINIDNIIYNNYKNSYISISNPNNSLKESINNNDLFFFKIPIYPHNILTEVKPMIEFDKDKNMIINQKIDIVREYKNSHRLVMTYLKNDNIEGLKFEACRLYYLNYLIDKKLNNPLISKSNYKKTTYNNLKSNTINDLNRCYNKFPKDFNFGEYYNNSDFSYYSSYIDNTTIKGISSIIKKLI